MKLLASAISAMARHWRTPRVPERDDNCSDYEAELDDRLARGRLGDAANAARAASLRPQPASRSSQSGIAIAGRVSTDHGECPHCGEDLNGGSIWEFYRDHCGNEAEADAYAAQFGATRTCGRWNLATLVKLVDGGRDRWRCPECAGEWEHRCRPENLHALAQGGEAGTAETGTVSVHEHPVAESDAPKGRSKAHRLAERAMRNG